MSFLKEIYEFFSLINVSFYELLMNDKTRIPKDLFKIINDAYSSEGLLDTLKLLYIIKKNEEILKEYLE